MKPWSWDWKNAQLRRLESEWAECNKCELCYDRKSVVFGSGNPAADFMVIGGAPGEVEDEEGCPFVGPSGEVLRELLAASGLNPEEDVYMTNCVMCHPPDNRDPHKKERQACLPRLARQIYIIDPLIIIASGKEAFKALVGGRASSIDKQHGEIFHVKMPGSDFEIYYDIMPIYDGGYVLQKDSRDRQGNWKKGGLAHGMFADLSGLLEIVTRLRELHVEVKDQYRREG